jgi:hypothetical protein
MRELADAGRLILPSAAVFHNVRFRGLPALSPYLRRRIDNRTALKVCRMVSATASD